MKETFFSCVFIALQVGVQGICKRIEADLNGGMKNKNGGGVGLEQTNGLWVWRLS